VFAPPKASRKIATLPPFGLIGGDRVRPGAGAADGTADPYLPQHGDELRAVRGLACGQYERQRAARAVGGEVDLAGLPAPGASQEGGIQAESASAPGASSLLPLGVCFGFLPVSFSESPLLAWPSPGQ
jgi:hypothetical protein